MLLNVQSQKNMQLIDTNVILRVILNDIPEQASQAVSIIENGHIQTKPFDVTSTERHKRYITGVPVTISTNAYIVAHFNISLQPNNEIGVFLIHENHNYYQEVLYGNWYLST